MMVINLFGGPGSGKSTLASELFTMMKKLHYKVELSTEFAKDLVYADENVKLRDQLLVFAEQHHRLFRLQNKVDYVIVDSPLLFSKIYNKSVDPKTFNPLVDTVFNSYNNINFFIKRGNFRYQKYGRQQNLSESKEIDDIILNILEDFDYKEINDIKDIKKILNLKEKNENL